MSMGLQIVMDSGGDTRHKFDRRDPKSVAEAKERFQTLTSRGFRAVALGKDGGDGTLLERFDPQVERMLFIPQLRGG
jgi:hypothetical protein